jgi:hypothetical protein
MIDPDERRSRKRRKPLLRSAIVRLWSPVRGCLSYCLYILMEHYDERGDRRAVKPRGARRS